MTKLYLIESTDENGCDCSAVVEATDPNDAVNQWHVWLKEVWDAPDDEPIPNRMIFELPEKNGTSRSFGWHVAGGVIEHEI
jgi:hypothetical protein